MRRPQSPSVSWRPLNIGLITAGLCVAGLSGPFAQVASRTAEVTFAKDVAPIFRDKCQRCHRPGEMAPMSLLTYADARPWARAIKAKVVAREMPPWFVDTKVG